eukprot:Selendium_serpulae@DN6145_c0_g2_i2.p1
MAIVAARRKMSSDKKFSKAVRIEKKKHKAQQALKAKAEVESIKKREKGKRRKGSDEAGDDDVVRHGSSPFEWSGKKGPRQNKMDSRKGKKFVNTARGVDGIAGDAAEGRVPRSLKAGRGGAYGKKGVQLTNSKGKGKSSFKKGKVAGKKRR